MARSAGIVLAGGRSTRMGVPKAALEWHGSTLLRRVSGILGRAVDGPVIVVRAPGQRLPALPASVRVVADAREGEGPLEGLAAGLAALVGIAEIAYVSATDAPLLHPEFVRAVIRAAGDADVALPYVGGHRQPLAAAYRISLLPVLRALLAGGDRRPGALFERVQTRELSARELLADPALAAADPRLESLLNLNDPAAYEAARGRPAPRIEVTGRQVSAATLGAALAAAGVAAPATVEVGGKRVAFDSELPLVRGDVVGS
jgi:molybdopterin-guanine dinucleotide biosynthesis protein A